VYSELLALAVFCALAAGASAQEPSSNKDPGFGENPPRGEGVAAPSSSSRRLPDALKFAAGLLRQKKYDLAAEEYERFANSGATGKDLDDARFGLATARLYLGNYREARRAFDEFLKDAPADPRGIGWANLRICWGTCPRPGSHSKSSVRQHQTMPGWKWL
jgi:TolA-binding protein